MSRFSLRLHGGRHGAVQSAAVVNPAKYWQPMPGNPFFGAVHDGVSQGYMQGYAEKPVNWLYRFRYNVLPVGQTTGMYHGNIYGKPVHWLEVSTMERFRVQAFGEEAIPILWLSIAVVSFTIYHGYRGMMEHSDGSWWVIATPAIKPRVKQTRWSQLHPMENPLPYKYIQRCPEWYSWDHYKEFVKLGIIANDPFLEKLKEKNLVEEALLPANEVVTGGKGDVLSKLWDEERYNKGWSKKIPLPQAGRHYAVL